MYIPYVFLFFLSSPTATTSSATAEKHTCAADALFLCGSYIGIGSLHVDREMHRTPQNRRGCILFLTFKRSDSRRREVLAKNAFCHEIATQGHLRSFILHSFAGRQWVAYRHIIILLAVSDVFEDVAS